MPSERSWSQKTKTVGFHLHEVPRVVKLTETVKQIGGCQGLGGRGKGQLCNGCDISVLQAGKVLKTHCITV